MFLINGHTRLLFSRKKNILPTRIFSPNKRVSVEKAFCSENASLSVVYSSRPVYQIPKNNQQSSVFLGYGNQPIFDQVRILKFKTFLFSPFLNILDGYIFLQLLQFSFEGQDRKIRVLSYCVEIFSLPSLLLSKIYSELQVVYAVTKKQYNGFKLFLKAHF